MFDLMKGLFSSKGKKTPPKANKTNKKEGVSAENSLKAGAKTDAYDDLQSADVKKRLNLAKDTETRKEILYYLAEQDPDPRVRQAVIENASMPVQAAEVLVTDPDKDVRLSLAQRLMGLLPDLSQDKHSQLYAYAVQALGTLALDEVLKIRVALSATLKDHAHTPPKVASQLARDVEREVSEPVLRFCAALSDEDLLDILRTHPEGWAVEAIAERPEVSEKISHAVIESDHMPGGTSLLKNEGALISVDTLHTIVEKAKTYPEWHKPIASRAQLPSEIAKSLAEFVDASVRDILMNRGDFDEELTEEIASVFRRRVDFASEEDDTSLETVEERLSKAIKENRLNEETISDAVAMRDRVFVYGAIAHLAKTDIETIKKIFELKAPKSIVAICWKAGLSMRAALLLQKELAFVAPKDLLYPRGGTDYPLSEEQIIWQLDFLGLDDKRAVIS